MPIRNYRATQAEFKPFTFDELLKPALMATQAHEAQQEAIAAADEKAAVLRDTALANPDSEAAKMYLAFSDRSKAISRDLARNGLSANSRQSIVALRKLYGENITPLIVANAERQKHIDLYDKQKIADPSWVGANPRNYELSDYLHGNSPSTYGVSGAKLKADMATIATSLSKQIQVDPNTPWKNGGDGYQYRPTGWGFTQDEINGFAKMFGGVDYNTLMSLDPAALMNNPSLRKFAPMLMEFRNNLSSYEMNKLSDSDKNILVQQAMSGIIAGMAGEHKLESRQDVLGAENRAFARQMALQSLKNAGKGGSGNGQGGMNATSVNTARRIDDKNGKHYAIDGSTKAGGAVLDRLAAQMDSARGADNDAVLGSGADNKFLRSNKNRYSNWGRDKQGNLSIKSLNYSNDLLKRGCVEIIDGDNQHHTIKINQLPIEFQSSIYNSFYGMIGGNEQYGVVDGGNFVNDYNKYIKGNLEDIYLEDYFDEGLFGILTNAYGVPTDSQLNAMED